MTKNNPDIEDLAEAFLSLKTKAECKRFMQDLLTEQEISDFALRWKVARDLNAGATYTQIEEETGLSSATIARISKWLNDGSGGYQMVLQRLEK